MGERVAALAASFDGFEKYEHDRWHKLANDMQPLLLLPQQLARDLAKFEGRIEASVDKAVEKAVAPINSDVNDLKSEVAHLRSEIAALKADRQQWSGARMLGVWIVQTAIAAASAIAAMIALGRHP